ncbi:DNA-binding protein [Oerskovia paurometabola]|uniref:DNA-binding protein n=1 Tax=Oerskovia paurometabola TaxID=162170 RepID=A0ABW1XH49_9CELL|nr:DNA-binding protein [Oerskovia paurometabola]MBM7497366.1 hypothetical protein [Oerskovia paurometabola]
MPRNDDTANAVQAPPAARAAHTTGADRTTRADHAQARREHDARTHLLAQGADGLEPRPWQPASVPPSAVDLARFALWRSTVLPPEHLLDALALLPAARAEVDGLESGLLFTARSAGLTWAQIADAMGFNSPQACQQHFHRLTARQEGRA